MSYSMFEAPFMFVYRATKSPTRASQEKEIHNNDNVGRRLFLTVLVLLVNTAQMQAQSYGIIDLGVLSGDNKSIGGGLNDAGQAAGTSSNPSNATATLFSNGNAINLGNLGGDVSLATAINSAIPVACCSSSPQTAAW